MLIKKQNQFLFTSVLVFQSLYSSGAYKYIWLFSLTQMVTVPIF